jgi:hypothetical protein
VWEREEEEEEDEEEEEGGIGMCHLRVFGEAL